MKEDFLHHVWQHKKFAVTKLQTTTGESIQILNSGQFLQLAGPDFFNAQLVIGNQKWAGNIEIHLKSSDWYLHQHEKDAAYDSVILHVVWEYDTPVFRENNTEIPTVELKKYVPLEEVHKYQSLVATKTWIYCENQTAQIPSFVFDHWLTRLYFERLERKSAEIEKLLSDSNNDWEAVLFCMLAKNFGLNTNGLAFLYMAKGIPFSVIRKEAFSLEKLEALFFGQANMLSYDFQDQYAKNLSQEYDYLAHKYNLKEKGYASVAFFKHRPDNFPTIRLAQLAALYHKEHNLFSKLMQTNTLSELYSLFNVSVSEYWDTHYNFDKISSKKRKKISTSFIDLLILNTIVPLKFAYDKFRNQANEETLLSIVEAIPSEKNAIIQKFKEIGVISTSAFESQALLQLKNEYCEAKKCLQCAIGLQLLKK
jgi:hypothetical protein